MEGRGGEGRGRGGGEGRGGEGGGGEGGEGKGGVVTGPRRQIKSPVQDRVKSATSNFFLVNFSTTERQKRKT